MVDVVGADIIRPLCCSIQHILDKNTISSLWIIYQNMGYGANEFAVLDDGAAGHADVK